MLLVGRRDAALLRGTGAEGGLPAPLTALAAKELRRSLLVRGLEVEETLMDRAGELTVEATEGLLLIKLRRRCCCVVGDTTGGTSADGEVTLLFASVKERRPPPTTELRLR